MQEKLKMVLKVPIFTRFMKTMYRSCRCKLILPIINESINCKNGWRSSNETIEMDVSYFSSCAGNGLYARFFSADYQRRFDAVIQRFCFTQCTLLTILKLLTVRN